MAGHGPPGQRFNAASAGAAPGATLLAESATARRSAARGTGIRHLQRSRLVSNQCVAWLKSGTVVMASRTARGPSPSPTLT